MPFRVAANCSFCDTAPVCDKSINNDTVLIHKTCCILCHCVEQRVVHLSACDKSINNYGTVLNYRYTKHTMLNNESCMYLRVTNLS